MVLACLVLNRTMRHLTDKFKLFIASGKVFAWKFTYFSQKSAFREHNFSFLCNFAQKYAPQITTSHI
jgi:hypothetical protein